MELALRRPLANGHPNIGLREFAEGLLALVGGAGFWSWLSGRGKVRSDELAGFRRDLLDEVRRQDDRIDRIATELETEREARRRVEKEKDRLETENSRLTEQVERFTVEVEAMQSLIEQQRQDIQRNRELVKLLTTEIRALRREVNDGFDPAREARIERLAGLTEDGDMG